jgi:hypothetical protein
MFRGKPKFNFYGYFLGNRNCKNSFIDKQCQKWKLVRRKRRIGKAVDGKQ